MPAPPASLRRAVTWTEMWPSVRAGVCAVALFGVGVWLARQYAVPIEAAIAEHAMLGILAFWVTSVVAVLAPMLTNLPLLPLAVLAWGPWWTASLLLAGWIVGAMLSFMLARQGRALVLRSFPSVIRHAQIDRLIHPRHRLASLILLRMTFPVDVLSYALGLFSQRTSLLDNLVSTSIGAAPFAVVFALFPTLSGSAQAWVFGVSVLVFAGHVHWVLHRPKDEPPAA